MYYPIKWVSASMFVACALLLLGTFIFENDGLVIAEEAGSRVKTAEIKAGIEKNNTVNYLLILVLLGLGAWLQYGI
ncbi:MAG TPA: hypothetical protein VIM96_08685 [Pseudomonadales bacterium]